MTYFEELLQLPEYPAADGDFRFSANPNSGGGQSFLQGKFKNNDGLLIAPSTLAGKLGVFKLAFKSPGQNEIKIILEDAQCQYEIKPRSTGSLSMKLGVGEKINPSKALSTFLMLPEVCGFRKSENLAYSALAKSNYWLQHMRLDCEEDASQPNIVYLIPSDLVFGGGVESGGDASTQRHFRLDSERRIRDIIALSQKEFLPDSIRDPLKIFADIYTGSRPFSYLQAKNSTDALMSATVKHFPTRYSGIDDPLPTLVELTPARTEGTIKFRTGIDIAEKRNIIIFGAPGTGKSKLLDQKKDTLLGDGGGFERVTFHPDYSYAHFVGTYKPVPAKDSDGKETITYKYVPGPIMRVLAAALSNGKTQNVKPYLLLIEEINRASPAAVFGDTFQLLDRNGDNVSEYPIHPSDDVRQYLADEVGGSPSDYEELRIPDNMFIWGSMNSADQGVFPMDTAFKRRWDFIYIGIDDNDTDLVGKLVTLGQGQEKHTIAWNDLRKSINNFLAEKGINEDKQIGPYFLSREVSVPADGIQIAPEPFVDAFKQKLLMYLFEDAARHYRSSVFAGCDHKGNRYSNIRSDFEHRGIHIFNPQIVDRVSVHNPDDAAPQGANTE